MGIRLKTRAGIGLAAAIFAITALAPSASAQTDLRGRWNGYAEARGIVNPGPPQVDASFFDVTAQLRGRFMGALGVPAVQDPIPHLYPVAGFVLPNGTFFGSGSVAGRGSIAFTGRSRAIIDPNLFPPSPIVLMALFYAEFDPLGRLEGTGYAVQIQMQGGLNWQQPGPVQVPAVQGMWDGLYRPSVGPGGGCITMDLLQRRNDLGGLTTSFMGRAHMDNVFVPAVQSFFDVTYDLQGTVGVPAVQRDGSLSAAFGAVAVERNPGPAQSPTGIIAILIGNWRQPGPPSVPAVQGNYRLYGSFFDVFTELYFGLDTAFGQGSFEQKPGPIQNPPG